MATRLVEVEQVYQVCIPNTSRDYFDYLATGLSPALGARVWVPFRNKERLGLVISINSKPDKNTKLKTISRLIDEEALLSEEILALCHWVSAYYQSPLSEVLPLVLPKKYRLGEICPLPITHYYQLTMAVEKAHELLGKKAAKQHALLDFLAVENKPLSKKTLIAAGYNQTQLTTLTKTGLLQLSEKIRLPERLTQAPPEPALKLNAEQQHAVATISAALDTYHCFLLQGVTGSGKTEVYLQVIAKVLAKGQQVLVLVPEIGLTPQLLSRFTARFSEPMVVIHSNLNETERQRAWLWAKDKQAKLVIGTRTAIFTPLPNLGLIVIDEEHDSSLKQMEGVRYSARDTALIRAHQNKVPIILGSATPSLESLYNCNQKKYSLLSLTEKALDSSPLHYQVVDIRSVSLIHGLAAKTLAVIKEHLQQDNQVLVFINRRGFAPVLLCHQCGWMADCQACDSHLTLHRQLGRLVCHHCGINKMIPQHCQSCHSQELLPVGAGTQRIHEYLQGYFPETNLLRIDRDEVKQKDAFDKHLERINRGDAQLIVGTQMLAKGHHFPRLTLVVILDTDAGFYNQDFRALERLGQLLTQVAGRAGRAQYPGEVLIQTHLPHHPLLNLLIQQGYDAFAQALLGDREAATLPPYHYLALIRAQDKKTAKVLHFLHTIKDYLQSQNLNVRGPAPAPLARKAEQHRMQLLLKSPSRKKLQLTLTALREWLTINKLANNVRWNVDVDPMDLS